MVWNRRVTKGVKLMIPTNWLKKVIKQKHPNENILLNKTLIKLLSQTEI